MKDVAVVGYCRTGIANGVGDLLQMLGMPMAGGVSTDHRTGFDLADVEAFG